MHYCVQTKQLDSKYLLRFKDVSPLVDNGNYTCVVSNHLGEIRATTQLLVTGSSSLCSLLTSNVIYVLMLSLCTDVTYVAVCRKKVCDIFKLFSEFLFHNVNDYKKLKDLVWLQDELRQSDYDQHVCSSRIPDNPTVSHLPGVGHTRRRISS